MYQQLHDPAFLAVASGGTPALDLFFSATKTLDSRITFTRASTATFINSSGLVEIAASGSARFTHDPVTMASLGLLIEESRTNLLLNSATLSTQNVTVSATAYTLSFTGTGSITRSGTSTGTLTGTGDGEANRVKVTFTPTAGTLTLTVSGTVTNAQLEAGAFATSYIPTTSATVTRAADVATMTGTNFSTWYNQTEGTAFLDISGGPSTSFPRGLSFSNGTNPEQIWIASDVTRVRVNNVEVAGFFTATDLVGKYALAVKENDFACARNGVLQTDSSGGMPPINQLRLGANIFGSGVLNGTIARIRYYRRRLPNANLQSLTT